MLLWPWTVLASGENYKPSQETLHGNGIYLHGPCSAWEFSAWPLLCI